MLQMGPLEEDHAEPIPHDHSCGESERWVREDDHCCESGGALARGSKRHGVPPAKVLLVDLDPQGNCATSFGVEKRRIKHTTYDLLVHEGGEPLPLMKEYFLGPKELTESMRRLSNRTWHRAGPRKSECREPLVVALGHQPLRSGDRALHPVGSRTATT